MAELEKTSRILVHAKTSGKLSGPLQALKLTGGTLVGQTPDGGAVVEVAEPAAAETRAAAGGARVGRELPPRVSAVNRLILSYGKVARPSAADLQKNGLQVI